MIPIFFGWLMKAVCLLHRLNLSVQDTINRQLWYFSNRAHLRKSSALDHCAFPLLQKCILTASFEPFRENPPTIAQRILTNFLILMAFFANPCHRMIVGGRLCQHIRLKHICTWMLKVHKNSKHFYGFRFCPMDASDCFNAVLFRCHFKEWTFYWFFEMNFP